MSGAVDPPFCDAWIWNVVHRNAPGAMSAMALTVMPVSVRLRFISPACTSATLLPPLLVAAQDCSVRSPADAGMVGLERDAALRKDNVKTDYFAFVPEV